MDELVTRQACVGRSSLARLWVDGARSDRVRRWEREGGNNRASLSAGGEPRSRLNRSADAGVLVRWPSRRVDRKLGHHGDLRLDLRADLVLAIQARHIEPTPGRLIDRPLPHIEDHLVWTLCRRHRRRWRNSSPSFKRPGARRKRSSTLRCLQTRMTTTEALLAS
jgi:hypothetical protein